MSTESFIRKASEGDVVEFLEDYPRFGIRKGQRGVVINELDNPSEAYDIEVEDQQGNFVAFAYSVQPEHIANLTHYAFYSGIAHLSEGNIAAARNAFAEAIELRPGLIGTLMNLFGNNYAVEEKWEEFAFALRILLDINPSYEYAKTNLAVAYINLGVRYGMKGEFDKSLYFLYRAAGITSDSAASERLRENMAATFFGIGHRAHLNGDFDEARDAMRFACSYNSTNKTRRNLAAACMYAAHHYIESGKFDFAVDAYEEAMHAFQLDADHINTYAICLIHVGRTDDAKWAFQRALSLAPDDPLIRANLEILEERLSSTEQVANVEGFRYEVKDYSFVPIELLAQSYQQTTSNI